MFCADNDNGEGTPMKRCSKCGEEKPATAEYFQRDAAKKDGLRSRCKACWCVYYAANKEREVERQRVYYEVNKDICAERQRTYKTANRERIVARDRAYREVNKERDDKRYAERRRAYRQANRDRRNAQNRAWLEVNREHRAAYREANKERRAEYNRGWGKTNPEKARAIVRNRRARLRAAEGMHTAADIQAQYARQKGKCYWCGIKVGDTYHADHIVPLSRGGSNWPENIVIACPYCNMSKGNRLPHEWGKGGRLL